MQIPYFLIVKKQDSYERISRERKETWLHIIEPSVLLWLVSIRRFAFFLNWLLCRDFENQYAVTLRPEGFH
jgi:hypothetical protein